MVERVLAGETVTHVELVLVTASGVAITVEGNLSCTLQDGRPPMVRGIYRDVTERSGWRSSCAGRSGCRRRAGSRAAWRTRSTT